MRNALAVLAVSAVLGLGGCSDGGKAEAESVVRRHTVVMRNNVYSPASLTVRVGDTVVWVNRDAVPHTVTAPGAWDSGNIPARASWRLVTRKRGTFNYVCTLHPGMKGRLQVR